MMDETTNGTPLNNEEANNSLPDILEDIPEPSLVTENGFKYYAENDITSWLKGFNVFVLAVDSVVTSLNNRIAKLEFVGDETPTTSIVITQQPPSLIECNINASYQVRVVATGDDLQYQWQISKDNGTTWTDSTVDGARSNTIYFVTSQAYNNRMYRCIITDASGESVISEAVKIIIVG